MEIQEAEVFAETEAEYKEFEPWLKNGWFHLKPVFSGFKTWLKFIKFGLGTQKDCQLSSNQIYPKVILPITS